MSVDDINLAISHSRVYIANYFDSLTNQIDVAAEQELAETTQSIHCDAINAQRHEMVAKVKTFSESLINRVQIDRQIAERFKTISKGLDTGEIGKFLFGNECMFFLEKCLVQGGFGTLVAVKDEYIGSRGINYLRETLQTRTEDTIIQGFSRDHALAFCLREVIQSNTSSIIEISLNIRLRKHLEFYKHGVADPVDGQNAWRKYKIGSFVTGVFDGFSDLQEVDLSNQAIHNLDPEILKPLTKLKKISFCGNLLNFIEPELFQGLPQMESINLGVNRLQSLDANVFQNMPKLSMLSLPHNQLSQETVKDSLRNLSNLKAISLANNNFTELTTTLFHNLICLKIIDLNTNRIKLIDANAFVGTHHIEILDLANNELDTLNPEVFQHFSNLKLLNLKRNKLRTLDIDLFRTLTTIEVLDLSENQLEYLEPGHFKGLGALKLLYLYANQLKFIHPDLFEDAVLLEKVDLSRNPLESFDQNKLTGLSKELEVIYV